MQDGSFNDIQPWQYSSIPELFGYGKGYRVKTEGDLEFALCKAREYTEGFCVLDVQLDPQDCSPALKRLTEALGKKIQASKKL